MRTHSSSPAKLRAFERWRVPALVLLVGLVVLGAADRLRRPTKHPEISIVSQPDVIVQVPSRITGWPQFFDAYGPIPCGVARSTLRAAIDPGQGALPFPPDHRIKLVFDESPAGYDKRLSDAANKLVEDLLSQTGSCSS